MGLILDSLSTTEDRVDELIISQYKESPNLIAYIKAFVKPIQSVLVATDASINSRSIQIAEGYSLDKIAKVVGESRIILGAAPLGYFGFSGEPTALGLSEGMFYSAGDAKAGDLILTNEQLRNLIRARIILNTSGGKITDMILYSNYLIGRKVNLEITEGDASINLMFHEKLNKSERLLVSIRINNMKPPGISMKVADESGDIEVIKNDFKTILQQNLGEWRSIKEAD